MAKKRKGIEVVGPTTTIAEENSARKASEASGDAGDRRRSDSGAPEIRMIELGRILACPDQPRKTFDQAKLEELAESIREHGVLQPIVVRPLDDAKPDMFEIVIGERRHRAAGIAGLTEIPAIVAPSMEARDQLMLALVENLQREDLDAMERAEGFERLKALGMQVKDIAAKVNCSSSTISNSTKLTALPEEVKAKVRAGELNGSDAEALARYIQHPALLEAQMNRALSGTPSKDLEQVTSSIADTLVADKKGVTIGSYGCPFDRNLCQGCKDRRSIVNSYGGDFLCLNPECYEQKCSEANAAAEAEAREKMKLAEGTEIVIIAKLPWDSYKRIGGDAPKECKDQADCEHRKPALDRDGQSCTVCLDVKCYKKLESAVTRAKNKARRETLKVQWEQCRDRILGGGFEGEAVAMAIEPFFLNVGATAFDMALEQLPGLEIDAQTATSYGDIGQKLGMLAKVDAADLIKLAALVKVSHDFIQAGTSDHYTPQTMHWLLGRKATRVQSVECGVPETEDPDGDLIEALEGPVLSSVLEPGLVIRPIGEKASRWMVVSVDGGRETVKIVPVGTSSDEAQSKLQTPSFEDIDRDWMLAESDGSDMSDGPEQAVEGADAPEIVAPVEPSPVDAELPEGFTPRHHHSVDYTHPVHGEIRLREMTRKGKTEIVPYYVPTGKGGHGWAEMKGESDFPAMNDLAAYQLHMEKLAVRGVITIIDRH